MVTHVVLFKLKDATPERIEQAANVLRSMQGNVSSLVGLEVGINRVTSPRNYDLALITRFNSWDDLEVYRSDPYHVEHILAYLGEAAESSVVVDYVEPSPE